MFRAVCRSSSGAPNVFAASGLHTQVVTARSQVWVGRSPLAYVNQKLQIQWGLSWWWATYCSKHVELLMYCGIIINSVTKLHLVGYCYWVILRCTNPWILNLYPLFLSDCKETSISSVYYTNERYNKMNRPVPYRYWQGQRSAYKEYYTLLTPKQQNRPNQNMENRRTGNSIV